MRPEEIKAPGTYLAISADYEAAVMACRTFDGSGLWFYFPGDEMYYCPEDLLEFEMYGPVNLCELAETLK